MGGGALDEAPLSHPTYPNRLAIFDDHRNRAVSTGELEHTLVGIAVLFDVVLFEVHSAPLQILAGSGAVGTTRHDVEFYRFCHALSQSLDRYSLEILPDLSPCFVRRVTVVFGH